MSATYAGRVESPLENPESEKLSVTRPGPPGGVALAPSEEASPARPGRASPAPLEILKAFLVVGATAMGGGAAAYIHAAMVKRRGWLSETEFLEGMTLSRLLPGPNISNLAAYIGSKLAGPRGALAASFGMVLPGTVVILLLAGAYFGVKSANNPVLEGALYGIAATAVGVMGSVVARTGPAGLGVRGGLPIAVIAFVLSGVLGWGVLPVLGLLFPVALVLNRPRLEAHDG